MAQPRVRIIVTADTKQATAALRGLRSQLSGIGTTGSVVSRASSGWFSTFTATMAGFVGAQILDRMADGIKRLGLSALNSAAELQDLRIGLETLAAREIARGHVVERTRKVTIHLTEEEKRKLHDLGLEHQLLSARLQEEQERHRQLIARYGAEGLAVKRHAAQMAILREKLGDVDAEMRKLQSREGKTVTVTEKLRVGQMKLSDAMKLAKDKANDLLKHLQDISLVSPYEYQAVAGMFRMQMAFGQTSDMALKMTRAILDVAAGLGLNKAQLDRMSYALGEINMTGRISAIRLRELRMVGVDLADVFQTELGLSVEQVNERLKSGKMTMKDVSEAFVKYAKENFAGAAERMSQTWHGLMSSFHDLWFFASKDLMTPLLERITKRAQKLWAWGRKLNESGGLKSLGEALGRAFDRVDRIVEGSLLPAFLKLARFGVRLYHAFVAPLHMVAEAFGPRIRRNVQEFLDRIRGVSKAGEGLGASIEGLMPTIEMLAGRLVAIASSVLPVLGSAIQYVADHWNTFKYILGGFAAAVVAVNAPITAIIAAISALALAWDSDWGGIQEKTRAVIAAIAPTVESVVSWLQVTIPTALQFLGTAWQGTMDVLSAAWGFVSTDVLPIAQAVAGFFTNDLPSANETLADSILSVVEPAFSAIAGFLKGVAFPVLGALADVYIALVKLEFRVLRDLIVNVVIPAVKDMVKWLKDHLSPILDAVGSYIDEHLRPILRSLSEYITGTLVPAFGEMVAWLKDHILPATESVQRKTESLRQTFRHVRDIVQGVVDWLHRLADTLNHLKLPDWLERHSPSEFEITLMNVHRLLRTMPDMRRVFDFGAGGGFQVSAGGAMPPVVAGGGGTHVEYHYHLDYTAVRAEPDETDAAMAMQKLMLLAGVV